MRYGRRYSSRDYGWVWWIVAVAMFVVLIEGCIAGIGTIRSDRPAIHLAQSLGFSHVSDTGRSVWFVKFQGCADDDIVIIHLAGTNAAGRQVTLDVCEGILKGATARG